jgi:hypothetical protein
VPAELERDCVVLCAKCLQSSETVEEVSCSLGNL